METAARVRPADIDDGTKTLVDAFTVRGDWWLPKSPDHKVAGALRFDPVEGATLELMGSLAGLHTMEFGLYQVVLGQSLAGTPVTLTGCSVSDIPNSVFRAGKLSCDYAVSVVFRGCHFLSLDQIRLESLVVSYDSLPLWMQLQAAKESVGPNDNELVRLVRENRDTHQLDGATLTLHVRPEFTKRPGTFSVYARAEVEFSPEGPTHYSDLMRKYVYPMQYLLSLGTDADVHALSVEGTASSNPSGNDWPVWISYADRFRMQTMPANADDTPAVFGLNSLGADATVCLRNWFAKAEPLMPVADLYFGVVHHPRMYTTLRFLSYCQALETYHRNQRGGLYLEEARFTEVLRSVRNAIPSGLPAGLRGNISGRLKGSNELTLKDRLRRMFEELWPYVGLSLSDGTEVRSIDAERIIDLIVLTRNALTHKSTLPEDVTDECSWHLSRLLKMLIECVLLLEMGISPERLDGFVKPRSRYLHDLDALTRLGKPTPATRPPTSQ